MDGESREIPVSVTELTDSQTELSEPTHEIEGGEVKSFVFSSPGHVENLIPFLVILQNSSHLSETDKESLSLVINSYEASIKDINSGSESGDPANSNFIYKIPLSIMSHIFSEKLGEDFNDSVDREELRKVLRHNIKQQLNNDAAPVKNNVFLIEARRKMGKTEGIEQLRKRQALAVQNLKDQLAIVRSLPIDHIDVTQADEILNKAQ